MYFKPPAWGKPNNSQRKLKPPALIKLSPAKDTKPAAQKSFDLPPRDKPRSCLRLKKTVSNKVKTKYDKILPEVQIQIRSKASLSSLALKGTPNEIQQAMKFEYVLSQEAEIFQDIKKNLKQLRVLSC